MQDIKRYKNVAIIHDYLIQYGGAEKTLEALLEIFPNADIYTSLYSPSNMPPAISSKKIISLNDGFIGKIPGLLLFPKIFTFIMPWIFESMDVSKYDLVISNGTAWAKSVLTTPDQVHISYIHTPPRFLYGYSVETQKRNAWYFKPFTMVLDFFLRIWDVNVAQRPDYILTNSQETKKRIKKFYGRDAEVIYPPVDVPENPTTTQKNFYLILGRLSAYKNVDIVVKAAQINKLPLVVAGTGTEEKELKKLIRGYDYIQMTGKVSDQKKAELLSECKGLIFPVEHEDFGITPVEALAYGKPVLAHKSGGVLESIQENKTGMFFSTLTPIDLAHKWQEFDKKINNKEFDSSMAMQKAKTFSKQRFIQEFTDFICRTASHNI